MRAAFRRLPGRGPGQGNSLHPGTAGGSSDAAAVLKALNARYGNPLDEVTLMAAGESIGSDVPFCRMGGTALAEGSAEQPFISSIKN